MTTFSTLLNALYEQKFTTAELDALRTALKSRLEIERTVKLAEFKVGQRVRWYKRGGRHAGTHTGTVKSTTSKNFKVLSDEGVNWTIAPSHLTALEGA